MTSHDTETPAAGTSTDRDDVTRLLQSQHDEVTALFRRLDQPITSIGDLFCELRRLLAVHETAEEVLVYPALRHAGGDGDRIADERIVEEDRAKADIPGLEGRDPGSPEFRKGIDELRNAVTAHAEAEEREVFPMIRAHYGPDDLARMATAVRTAEAAAPTHPHPHAPSSATGHVVTGPFLAIADRVRDALSDGTG